MDEIRIIVKGDAKDLQPTIDKLAEVGAVDKKNAEQFRQSNAEFEQAAKKRARLLQEEMEDLEELQRMKRAAFSPEDIKAYERSIKDSQERIRLLSSEVGLAQKSMAATVSSTQQLGQSLSKSYGVIRQIANVLPGLGISGVILLGYEALASIIDEVTGSFEQNTEAIKYNNEALDKQIEYQEKLQTILSGAIEDRLVLDKKLTDVDKQKFKAQDDFDKRDQEITANKIKYLKELGDKYKLNGDDFEKYGNRIAKVADLTAADLKKIGADIALSNNEGLPGNLDQQLKIIQDYQDEAETYEAGVRAERRKNEEVLNEQIGVIQKSAYEKQLEEKKKAAKKIKSHDDDWWKIYLKQWKENFDELLRMYKHDADEFIKESDRKWNEAVKRGDDNVSLIIDNMQLEASLTQTKIDDENAAYAERLNNFKIQRDEKGQITEASQKHLELLEQQHNQNLLHIQYDAEQERQKEEDAAAKERKKKREQEFKETISNVKQVSDFILKEYEARIDSNVKYIDHQEELSRNAADAQRQLAIAGKENDLAYEEKRQADLEKQRAEERKKLKRAKELEIFLNAMADFSKDDPKQALGEALALMATTIAAEATFADKGGILGKIKEKSMIGPLGMSRRHASGKDILLHAEEGEGLLSVPEIANMGGEGAFMDFKRLLARPLREREIPLSGTIFQGITSTAKLERKVDNLTEVIRNKPEFNVYWETLRDRDFMIVEKMEKGVKDIMKHELRRPRFTR